MLPFCVAGKPAALQLQPKLKRYKTANEARGRKDNGERTELTQQKA
jgi:hypothetical protein